MARLPNTATKAELVEVHRAKMTGKKYDAARRYNEPSRGRTAITTRALARKLFGFGSIASANRHTGNPHEGAREIARRQRQAGI